MITLRYLGAARNQINGYDCNPTHPYVAVVPEDIDTMLATGLFDKLDKKPEEKPKIPKREVIE